MEEDGLSYLNTQLTCSNHYIWPVLKKEIINLELNDKRAFEIGCGNGAIANKISELGFNVTGIDISQSGINLANKDYPHIKLYRDSVYKDLASKYGFFPLVFSIEVIEHCSYPRKFLKSIYDLLEDNGTGIITTPYHGYWKNLAISMLDKWDAHHGVLWDGGHVKFFSEKTLSQILCESGFQNIRFIRIGRIPPIAKSIMAIFRK